MTDGHRRFNIFTFISRPALNWTIYEVIPHFKSHEALLITQHQYLIDIKFGHPLKQLWWKQWVKPYKYELENQCFEHGSTVLFTGFLVLFWPFASFKKVLTDRISSLGAIWVWDLTHWPTSRQSKFILRQEFDATRVLNFSLRCQAKSGHSFPLMLLIFGATSTHCIIVKIVRRKHLNLIVGSVGLPEIKILYTRCQIREHYPKVHNISKHLSTNLICPTKDKISLNNSDFVQQK